MKSGSVIDRLRRAMANSAAADELIGLIEGQISPFGDAWYVDAFNGSDTVHSGKSADSAFATLSKALSVVQTADTIFVKGDMREEGLTCSNLVFDVSIIGTGTRHHPDQPSSAYDPGGSMIRPPASPTAATNLLNVRGRGWRFINLTFDAPVDAAAVSLKRNASSGTDEYDASHAQFIGCLFRQGQYGIEFADGCHNVLVDDCEFFLMNASGSGAAIIQTAAAVALGLKNTVRNCIFSGTSSAGANDRHLIAAWQGSHIHDNIFGKVTSTGLYVDLSSGNDNVFTRNTLGGLYAASDYAAGTNDIWYGNWCAVTTTEAPNGFSVTVPA